MDKWKKGVWCKQCNWFYGGSQTPLDEPVENWVPCQKLKHKQSKIFYRILSHKDNEVLELEVKSDKRITRYNIIELFRSDMGKLLTQGRLDINGVTLRAGK